MAGGKALCECEGICRMHRCIQQEQIFHLKPALCSSQLQTAEHTSSRQSTLAAEDVPNRLAQANSPNPICLKKPDNGLQCRPEPKFLFSSCNKG